MDDGDDILCLAVNVYWEEQELSLPSLPSGMYWKVLADTSGRYLTRGIPEPGRPVSLNGNQVKAGPRSSLVLMAERR